MSYTDLIRWVVDHIHKSRRKIINSRGMIVGSFMTEDLQGMYKFPNFLLKYEPTFVVSFMQKDCTHYDRTLPLIKYWRRDPSKHKEEKSSDCPIASLYSPFCYLTSMLCRLLGFKNVNNFLLD